MSKDKKELVSIIMPAYNTEDLIAITIDSVKGQTYENWELIIVDDCSTDATANAIKEYMLKDDRIKYFKLHTNSGAAMARNKAINESIGKYLAFLDSDDVWFPDKLTKQITFMEENDYYFTCTSYDKVDEEGNSLNEIINAKIRSDYNGVLKTCPGNSTVIYNAEKLGKTNIENIRKRNDYVMWLKIVKKAKYLYGLPETLSSHRVRKDSLSSNKFNLVKYHWYVYRKIEKLPLPKSIYILFYWILINLFRLR